MGKKATESEIAEWYGVTTRTVRRWVADGMPVHQRGNSNSASLYDTSAVDSWRFAEKSGVNLDLNAERARLAKEQADKAAMDNQLKRGETVSVHDVAGLWAKLASETRTRVMAVPVSIAPVVVGCTQIVEVKEHIETALHDALGTIGADRSGLPDGDTATTEADAEPVGGRVPEAKPRGKRKAG